MSKILHFFKGVNPWFWSKIWPILSDLFFLKAGLDMNVGRDLDKK